jgi:hypothetical protein
VGIRSQTEIMKEKLNLIEEGGYENV